MVYSHWFQVSAVLGQDTGYKYNHFTKNIVYGQGFTDILSGNIHCIVQHTIDMEPLYVVINVFVKTGENVFALDTRLTC